MAKKEKKEKVVPSQPNNVSEERLDRMEKNVMALTELVAEALKQKPVEKVSEKEKELEQAAKPIESYVPPEWRALVDEILGSEFGLNVSYPKTGGSFEFKVIVPMAKSNMGKAHREFYKVDARSRAITYTEGVEGIKAFLLKVKKNLETKKND